MKTKIILTGASGFLGQKLVEFLSENVPGVDIVAISRKSPATLPANARFVAWDGITLGNWKSEFEGATAVINLAGKSVNCRYNEKNKNAIMQSRLITTKLVGEAIEACENKPEVWMNAASATIYEHTEDAPNTEESTRIGTGFSVEVCKAWENAFNAFNHQGVRQITLRTTIVLGKNGGVTKPLKVLTKLGMGGKMGSGKQQFSWIHEEDFCRIVLHFLTHKTCSGAYNMAAPNPVTNKVLHQNIRKALGVPFGIPQPTFLLKFGAVLIGTETELILKSRYVISKRLKEEGFEFKFPTIDVCLKDVFSK